MKRTKQLIMSFVAMAVLGVGASARAQDSSTPPPSEPPPAAHSSSSNSISLGGGAGMGIGASFTLSGLGAFGPAGQFVYDASIFHIEALLGFASQRGRRRRARNRLRLRRGRLVSLAPGLLQRLLGRRR